MQGIRHFYHVKRLMRVRQQ